MPHSRYWRAIGGLTVLVAGLSRADAPPPAQPTGQDETLPSYRVLPCPVSCANSTPAEPIGTMRPDARGDFSRGQHGYVEGVVNIDYVIGTDGKVHDARIVLLLGPKEFGDNALIAIRHRTFKPATVDGKPVQQQSSIRVRFVDPHFQPGARPKITEAYRNAMSLSSAGNSDEALKLLLAAENETYLNLYERTTLAYALAAIYEKQNNERAAWRWISLALLDEGHNLDARALGPARRLGFFLAARRNELALALHLAQYLQPSNEFGDKRRAPNASNTHDDVADGRLAKAMADIRAAISGPRPIVVPAWLEEGPYWHHFLVRRTFAFNNIQGSLARLWLSCDQQAIESPVSSTAEWHVPATWSNCRVAVEGTVGTSFNFVELN